MTTIVLNIALDRIASALGHAPTRGLDWSVAERQSLLREAEVVVEKNWAAPFTREVVSEWMLALIADVEAALQAQR